MGTHERMDEETGGGGGGGAGCGKTASGKRGRVEARGRRGGARISRPGLAMALGIPGLLAAGCGEGGVVRTPETATGMTSEVDTRPTFTPSGAPPIEGTLSDDAGGTGSGGVEVVLTDPVESLITYEEADSVFRAGDYSLAASLFERYSARVPTNPWGPYMAGISAWRNSDHERAEAALRRTLDIDPGHTKATLNLARVLLERGKPADALAFASEVTEREPGSAEGWRVLGNVHGELGIADAAADAYRRAITIDPTDAWTMNNLGLLRIQEGRYGDAIPPLARATELRPDVARFQNNLGVALERTGRMAQAVDAYAAALVVEEGYERARVSFERTSALVSLSTTPPIDLTLMAAAFAEEVGRWSGGGIVERSDETVASEAP